VTKTRIGTSDLRHAGTLTFIIPNVIPSTANELFVYVWVKSGSSSNGPYQDIKVFTQIATTRYERYIRSESWRQNAININSENMWFPMPTNRRIYITIPRPHGVRVCASLDAIGYR
jgi:hypothetical protein